MTRRRHATRAVTAAAGIALVAVGGFGLLAQPHASAASASPSDICILPGICIPTGGSSTPAPTSPAPATSSPAGGGTTTPASPSSTPSDQSTQSIGPQPTLYTGPAQPQATQAGPSGPTAGPNLAATGLVIRKVKGKLDVLTTVTNTGTVLLQNVPLNVSASGVGTQQWTITLNPGQHLSFHTRWPFRATPRTKTAVVVIDPENLIAETSKADNRLSRTKTFR